MRSGCCCPTLSLFMAFFLMVCCTWHFKATKISEPAALDINVLVINLDRHPHKMEYMRRQLDYLRIRYSRIPAVDGKLMQRVVSQNRSEERTHSAFDLDNRSKLDLMNIDKEFNAIGSDGSVYSKGSHYGVIGCMQSHIKAYFFILDSVTISGDADRPWLILEDDVLMERNFTSLLKEALRLIASDWAVFAIGHIAGTCVEEGYSSSASNAPCRSHHFYATHAYLVRNASVAQRLLSYSNTPEPQIADHYWQPHFLSDLPAYIMFPHTIADQHQLVFRSELRGFQQQVPAITDPIDGLDMGLGLDDAAVGLEDQFAQNMLHEMQYNELFAQQIEDKYYEHPHNAYMNNLMGVLSTMRGDEERAIEYFRRTCVLDAFVNEGYIRNYIGTGYSRDPDAVVQVLQTAVDGSIVSIASTPSPLLFLVLIDIYELRQRRDLAYTVSCRSVTALVHNYDLWTIFIRYHMDLYLSADVVQKVMVNGPSSVRGKLPVSPQQDRVVRLGLQLFPRSPELLLIHALHVYSSGSGDDALEEITAQCSVHFLRLSRQFRALSVRNISSEILTLTQRLLDLNYPLRDKRWTTAHCKPLLDHHDLDSWRSNYNNIHEPQLEGGQLYSMPSLQIGCSDWRKCSKAGWLIVDAVESISTHFVTSAHDLSMLADRSVQLVYSSHTLEHLSQLQVVQALGEWQRVLVSKGRLMVAVPDMDAIAAAFSEETRTPEEKRVLMLMIYGGQNNEHDFHRSGFYFALLQEQLQSAGFCSIERVSSFGLFDDVSSKTYAGISISLNVQAVKC